MCALERELLEPSTIWLDLLLVIPMSLGIAHQIPNHGKSTKKSNTRLDLLLNIHILFSYFNGPRKALDRGFVNNQICLQIYVFLQFFTFWRFNRHAITITHIYFTNIYYVVVVVIPVTRRVRCYTRFIEKYVIGRRQSFHHMKPIYSRSGSISESI